MRVTIYHLNTINTYRYIYQTFINITFSNYPMWTYKTYIEHLLFIVQHHLSGKF